MHDPEQDSAMPRTYDETLKSPVKGDATRRLRLAAELRNNLKKRKDRARALAKADRTTQPADASKD